MPGAQCQYASDKELTLCIPNNLRHSHPIMPVNTSQQVASYWKCVIGSLCFFIINSSSRRLRTDRAAVAAGRGMRLCPRRLLEAAKAQTLQFDTVVGRLASALQLIEHGGQLGHGHAVTLPGSCQSQHCVISITSKLLLSKHYITSMTSSLGALLLLLASLCFIAH